MSAVKKRETSVSVVDLRNTVKRLAISSEEMNGSQPIVSVFSAAHDNFEAKYEKLNEIGRGGFSVVYQCREKISGNIFAVKVVNMLLYNRHAIILSSIGNRFASFATTREI